MKIKILCATAIALVIRQAVAAESELQFNPAFLNGERANSADLAWVNAGSALPPGEYNLNVYINTQFAFTGNVTFRVAENTAGEALPCLTPAQFAALGIDSRQAKGGELPPAQRCIFLTQSYPQLHRTAKRDARSAARVRQPGELGVRHPCRLAELCGQWRE